MADGDDFSGWPQSFAISVPRPSFSGRRGHPFRSVPSTESFLIIEAFEVALAMRHLIMEALNISPAYMACHIHKSKLQND